MSRYSGRRRRRRRRAPWGILLCISALTAFFLWSNRSLQTEATGFRSAHLPAAFDGFRIVLLSDLHGAEFGEDNAALLERVAAAKPDIIAVTGDLIDREEQLAMVPALVKGLAEIAPTYYVTGNHEWGVRRVNDLKELLRECGVIVLSGNYVLLEREGEVIAVAGVDDPGGPGGLAAGAVLKEKIAAEQGEIYTLFLSHRDSLDVYEQWGYDLTLCGHGHGGIFRIPVLNKGVLSTDRTFFPEYDGGLYDLDGGNACVVSRGLGSNTVPIRAFRLFNRPDLPLVILQRSDLA